MIHKVASRFDEKYKDDRCPKCNFLNQNFIYISDKELACYKCGLVFINHATRTAMLSSCRDMLLQQDENFSGFPCPECDFRAKSKAGLVAHMVKHKK